MSPWRYHYSGVRIASEVELPEWRTFAAPDDGLTAEVTIQSRLGTPEAAALRLEAGALVYGIPGVADYRIEAGRRILLTTPDGRAERLARLYLLGSAWGALGYQRGWFPLHAGVVALEGGAVAFCAPSGGGKSSLVAGLLAQGGGLISDDLCRLDIRPAPRVWRSLPGLKLKPESLARLSHLAGTETVMPPGEDKHHYFPPALPEVESLPLSAIYLLAWGDAELRRLRGLEAVNALLEAATYRPEFVTALGLSGAYWQSCIDLARAVPIYRYRRPRDWSAPELLEFQLARDVQLDPSAHRPPKQKPLA